MKLQQAYFVETNKIGGWTLVGYQAPVSQNFTYSGAFTTDQAVETSTLTTAKNGFEAANKVKLNDCEAAKNWTVAIQFTSGKKDVDYTASAGSSAGCQALTPSFTQISQAAP